MRSWLLCAGLLFWSPWAAANEAGWLERSNRALFALNAGARQQIEAAAPYLPATVPAGLHEGAANLFGTWVAAPWQALALTAAGRPADARLVLDRVGANIMHGRGGLRDAASAQGLPEAPAADIGLALCAHGVPEGPYLVLPILGGRTLRDGLSEVVVAGAVLYGALLPFTGPAPPVDALVGQVLDTLPVWAMAAQLQQAGQPAGVDFERSREVYLAGRRHACERLRQPG